jgi:short-subunit dehydrogenase
MSQITKTVLLLGATSGLGYEIAKQIAPSQQYKIVITGRSLGKLQLAAEQLNTIATEKILTIQFDQSSEEDIGDLFHMLQNQQLEIDVLIMCVGINLAHEKGFRKMHVLDMQDFKYTFLTNIFNAVNVCKTALDKMRKRRTGKIVILGSLAYKYGVKGQLAYSMSKSALAGMHNTIVNEYPYITSLYYELGVLNNARNEKYLESLRENSAVNLLDMDKVATLIVNDILNEEKSICRSIA